MLDASKAWLGRRLGHLGFLAAGDQVRPAVAEALKLGRPTVRALVDSFIVDRLAGAIWPSMALLGAVLGLHALGVVTGSMEAERILTGLAILAALAWSAHALVSGARAVAPHLRLWLVTRLSPQAHVRLLVFGYARDRLKNAQNSVDAAGPLWAAAARELQQRVALDPERLAFRLTDELAPHVVRQLSLRLAQIVAPVVCAVLYYRLVIYPDLVAAGTGAGPWVLALYPFAALVDVVAGTTMRGALIAAP